MSLCGLSGCWGEDRSLPSGPVKPSFLGVKLAVGALGDSAILTGLSAQRGEWVASRGGDITIKDEPIRSLENLSDLDLLIFPGQELGNLVDADVLEWLKAQGKGYQSRINAILRREMLAAHRSETAK